MNQNRQSHKTSGSIKQTINLLFVLLFVLGCDNLNKRPMVKDFSDKIQELVLSENIKGKEYSFNIDESKNTLEYNLVYIGDLTVKNEKNKVLYETILSGNNDSPQLNSYLIIYDNQNNRLGVYYIGSLEIPKIQNNGLFFKYEGGECNQTTTISFKDSIPKEIFINCTEKGGDLYKFEIK